MRRLPRYLSLLLLAAAAALSLSAGSTTSSAHAAGAHASAVSVEMLDSWFTFNSYDPSTEPWISNRNASYWCNQSAHPVSSIDAGDWQQSGGPGSAMRAFAVRITGGNYWPPFQSDWVHEFGQAAGTVGSGGVLVDPCIVWFFTVYPDAGSGLRHWQPQTITTQLTIRTPSGQVVANVPIRARLVGGRSGDEPKIDGQAIVGHQLNSSDGDWQGPSPASFSDQWQRCGSSDESSCSDITGATDKHYTIGAEDLGQRLRVLVSAHYGDGTMLQLQASTQWSDMTAVVEAASKASPTTPVKPRPSKTTKPKARRKPRHTPRSSR